MLNNNNNNIEIKDLVPFLEQNLKGYKIVDYNLDYLTKPGDNFGSIMYDLTVTVESIDAGAEPLCDAEPNKSRKMKLVAKTPVINPELVKVFQPEFSCIKENGMYHIVCPILQQLQIDANVNETDLIDVFVKCYGSRLSLNSDTQTKADNDAVLLLENLRVKGYQSIDRSKGFDSTFTFKILENLAQFHALPIAVRRLKPDVFKNKIMPILFEFNYYEAIDYERLCEQIKQQFKKTGLDDELCEKLNKQYRICEEFIRYNKNGTDTPYSTIVHRDFWVNNLMFLNDDACNNLKIKIFDFQLVSYKSLAIDVAFFLFTSVQSNVLEENFEEFLKHYYKYFCNTLKQVGCPVDDYSYDGFRTEFYYYAKLEFSHIILMIRVLMAKTDYDIDINEFSEDDMFDESGLSEEYFIKIKNICILFNKLKIID